MHSLCGSFEESTYLCDGMLPGLILQEANRDQDWKDHVCTWCGANQEFTRLCRSYLPWLNPQEANIVSDATDL